MPTSAQAGVAIPAFQPNEATHRRLIANWAYGLTQGNGSSLIGFIQPPNASAQPALVTVQDKLRDFVSASDFRPPSDGLTDAASAIQAAVTYAQTQPGGNGGRFHVPAGDYVLNRTISIQKGLMAFHMFGDGSATRFIAGSALSATAMFAVGLGSGAANGVDFIFEDMMVLPATAGGAATTGFLCENANGVRFNRMDFGSVNVAVVMSACYATRFTSVTFNGCKSAGVVCTTSAHNIIFDECDAFACGGTAGAVLVIASATDIIVMQNCDWESCGKVYSVASGCSAIRLTGCYIEYCANTEFNHAGTVNGWVVENCWIALNNGGTFGFSGGGTVTYNNIDGGRFEHNTHYLMDISWGAAVLNLDVGNNKTVGGAASVARAPFTTAGALSNGWSANVACGYKRLNNGTVQIRGALIASAASLGNVAFNIPAGYRPVQRMYFATSVINNSTLIGTVIVDTNGNVVPNVGGGSAGSIISMDNINYTVS